MYFPHNSSDQSISLFFNGRMQSIPSSHKHFAELHNHLMQDTHDYALVEGLVDVPVRIARLSEGLVEVVGSTVYYKSIPVNSTLADRLVTHLDAGHSALIWARFLERVMANPSERSRECLYDFLNHWEAPITEDGHIITFKRVTKEYLDIRTGRMDNSPGKVVEMPRELVNPDPDEHCSSGLHVAATSYLGQYASAQRSHTIACKVDPADVVAVPGDYGFTKMRVCKYLVLGDAQETFYNKAETVGVYKGTVGAVNFDSDGRPICTTAGAFDDNYIRNRNAPIVEGNLVTAAHGVKDLYGNAISPFLVGTVTKVRVDGEYPHDTFASVRWQSSVETADLRIHEDRAPFVDLIRTSFIGLIAEEEFEDEEEDPFDYDDGDDYDEEDPYCGECGNIPVDYEGDNCTRCEDRLEEIEAEELQYEQDRFDEIAHINDTGLTTRGEIASEVQVKYAADHA